MPFAHWEGKICTDFILVMLKHDIGNVFANLHGVGIRHQVQVNHIGRVPPFLHGANSLRIRHVIRIDGIKLLSGIARHIGNNSGNFQVMGAIELKHFINRVGVPEKCFGC